MSAATLPLSFIRCDGGTQPREAINDAVVSEYAERLVDGDEFPPVTVFYDGSDYWLADGFHRVAAHDEAGRGQIEADIRSGTRLDAVLHAAGANRDHGLRRTNADKRRAVLMVIEHPDASEWSGRKIASCCGVSPDFANRMLAEHRPSLSSDDSDTRTYTTKHGTVATMDVSGIREAAEARRLEQTGRALADVAAARADDARRSGETPPSRSTPHEKSHAPTGDPRRMLVLIRAAIDASYGADAASDADIAAIQTNDLMIAGLRKTRDLLDRVIRRHEAGTSRVTA
jgi:hypothetical protein